MKKYPKIIINGRCDMDDILWGCIADDFTGASDAASFFKKGGLKTVLCNGIPNENMIFDKDVKAVVIALKIRSAKKDESASVLF